MSDIEVVVTYFGGLTLPDLELPQDTKPENYGSNYVNLNEATVASVLAELKKGTEVREIKRLVKQGNKSLSYDQIKLIIAKRQEAYLALKPPEVEPEP